jgi:hypothetical protein
MVNNQKPAATKPNNLARDPTAGIVMLFSQGRLKTRNRVIQKVIFLMVMTPTLI